MSDFNKDILQEIEEDSKLLTESLELFSEESNDSKTPNNNNIPEQQPVNNGNEQPNPSQDKENKRNILKKKMVDKGNSMIKHMQKKISDREYMVNGYSYHSKMLYSMAVKYPFLGKTIGVPLMALTRFFTKNIPMLRDAEREKILDVYTSIKGDKAAVDTKIQKLEALQKPSNAQKEELMTLKKMSTELGFSLNRLEYNFKLSHIDEQKQDKSLNKKKYYRT